MKILVSGKGGVGKTSLIMAMRREAPQHEYEERADYLTDMEALGLADDESWFAVHLVKGTASVIGVHTQHAHVCMSIYDLDDPADAEDAWTDRARTLLRWIEKSKGAEG